MLKKILLVSLFLAVLGIGIICAQQDLSKPAIFDAFDKLVSNELLTFGKSDSSVTSLEDLRNRATSLKGALDTFMAEKLAHVSTPSPVANSSLITPIGPDPLDSKKSLETPATAVPPIAQPETISSSAVTLPVTTTQTPSSSAASSLPSDTASAVVLPAPAVLPAPPALPEIPASGTSPVTPTAPAPSSVTV